MNNLSPQFRVFPGFVRSPWMMNVGVGGGSPGGGAENQVLDGAGNYIVDSDGNNIIHA